MPITRRRRAQPPEEPDPQQSESAEALEAGQPPEAPSSPIANHASGAVDEPAAAAEDPAPVPFTVPEQLSQPAPEPVAQETGPSPAPPVESHGGAAHTPPQFVAPAAASSGNSAYVPVVPSPQVSNGSDSQPYAPTIEGGRRTTRGEFFRRPPQIPPTQAYVPPPAAAPPAPPPLQAPTHEITLPLGNLLHLAYNPGYTGADEARSKLLSQLAHESKSGGRARCWNCGSLAIVYDRWSTRSKTFGEVGIAYCEICGVWSVL